MNSTGFRRIGTADTIPRGQGMLIPRSGTGGGGEYGTDITDELRAFAMTREPVGYRTVFTVAHDVFDNWFKIELEGKEDSDTSEALDQKVQAELSRLNAKKEFTRMAIYERGFGWAIIVLGFVDTAQSLADPVTSPQALREIKAYSKRQINISKSDLDNDPTSERYGLPVYYNIRREGIAAPLRVHYTRVVHFATRLSDDSDWEGKSVLDPIWDDLGTLRNMRWGMGQTMYRYGSGFPDITFTGAELDDINDWIDSGAFANLNARTYFAHSEDQAIEFKGLGGHNLDPMNYYLPVMEHASCATGIPLAILRGVQAGALTGSEVNQGEYYGLISDEQSAYEDGIRQVITRILQFIPDKRRTTPYGFKFNWNSGIELAEDEKQTIALQRAQELDLIWNFKTRNEIRQEIDPSLKQLSKEEGGEDFKTKSFAVTPFQEQMQKQPFGQPQQQEKPNPLEQMQQGASYLVTEVTPKPFFRNAAEDAEGHWVTINGVHVLIKEGETISQAFKRTTERSLDDDSEKSSNRKENKTNVKITTHNPKTKTKIESYLSDLPSEHTTGLSVDAMQPMEFQMLRSFVGNENPNGEVAAFYISRDNNVIIRESFFSEDENAAKFYLTHEVGHHVWKNLDGKDMRSFKEIYDNHKKGLSWYGQTDLEEGFAEAYASLHNVGLSPKDSDQRPFLDWFYERKMKR